MEVALLAFATALVWKLVSVVKGLMAGDRNLVVTQVVTWGFGIAVAFLLAASDYASGVHFHNVALANMNAASVVLFGISLGSTASVAYDFKKARDNNDSAAEPKLIGAPANG